MSLLTIQQVCFLLIVILFLYVTYHGVRNIVRFFVYRAHEAVLNQERKERECEEYSDVRDNESLVAYNAYKLRNPDLNIDRLYNLEPLELQRRLKERNPDRPRLKDLTTKPLTPNEAFRPSNYIQDGIYYANLDSIDNDSHITITGVRSHNDNTGYIEGVHAKDLFTSDNFGGGAGAGGEYDAPSIDYSSNIDSGSDTTSTPCD